MSLMGATQKTNNTLNKNNFENLAQLVTNDPDLDLITLTTKEINKNKTKIQALVLSLNSAQIK